MTLSLVLYAILRFDGLPLDLCMTPLSPSLLIRFTILRICLPLTKRISAASTCLMTLSRTFRMTCNLFNSPCRTMTMSSPAILPSSLKEHYGIFKRGHFYCGQLGHYHFGITDKLLDLSFKIEKCIGFDKCKVE